MASKTNKLGRLIKATPREPTLTEASGIWTLDEAIQSNYINRWPVADLGQPIERSIRFDRTKNTYGTKPITRGSNGQRFTWSGWIKRVKSTSYMHWLGIGSSSSERTQLMWFVDYIRVSHTSTVGGNSFDVYTSAKFVDFANWYHVFISVDTTQATASDRVKIFVNGVQYTSLQGTQPTQNTVLSPLIVPGGTIYLNREVHSSQQDEAYHAETYYIDGYALNYTEFAQTNSQGILVPKAYRGNFGTNGFYLPYKNNTSSQALVYDYSNFNTYDVDQDPYRGHVALHLTGNGPSGGQNNTFVDSSVNNFTVTRNGTPTQGSFTPYDFDAGVPYNPAVHGGSGYFNGSTDYLTVPSSASFVFGSGDFTIEAWIYPTTSGTNRFITTEHSYGSLASHYFYVNTSNTLQGTVYISNVDTNLISDTVVPVNAWSHVAFGRNSNTLFLALNGVVKTTSISGTLDNPGQPFNIARQTNGTQFFPGYITDIRVIKGSGLYTSTFRPPRRPLGTSTKNLIGFSEELNNASWTKSSASVTTNALVAPDNSPTASLINFTSNIGNYAQIYYGRTLTANVTYTFSVWLAGAPGSTVTILVFDGPSVSTNTVTLTSTLTRYSVTHTTNASPSTGSINIQSRPGDTATYVYAWGAQLETGSSATAYTPTPENSSTAPSLLLNFSNATVVDSSGANNLTTIGDVKTVSFTRYGSGSLAFDGSGDYLQSSNNAPLALEDFTVEGWIYPRVVSGGPWGVFVTTTTSGSDNHNIRFGVYNSQLYADIYGFSGPIGGTIAVNNWYHVAFTRSKYTLRIFLDGKQVGIFNYTGSVTGANWWVGRLQSDGFDFTGNIDDLRVTRGIARYTTDFTPPNRPLPVIGGKSFMPQNITSGVVRKFTTTGTTSWTCPQDVTSVETLVVAGGGAGAIGGGGGGGGAGGLIYQSSYPVTPGQTYIVTVGAGGSSITGGPDVQGTSGSNSIFGNLIAIGGGKGAANGKNADSGGSGGGGYGPGFGQFGSGTAGQGFAGVNAATASSGTNGGGGGGAGGPGTSGSSTSGGNGGSGLTFSISGTPTGYAGGGAGGSQVSGQSPGTATHGGGAGGGPAPANGTAGTANTGGGGGGAGFVASSVTSGAGGSGIVILRYSTNQANQYDSTNDSMVDSPTPYGTDFGNGGEVRGNYATLNPLFNTAVLANGNLEQQNTGANDRKTLSTIAIPTTGNWYWEVEQTVANSVYWLYTGLANLNGDILAFVYPRNGTTNFYGPAGGYITSITETNLQGYIWSVAYNANTGLVRFFRNGVEYATNTTLPTGVEYIAFLSQGNQGNVATINFGQKPWKFKPPSGYIGLNTENLPKPLITNPSEHFKIVSWTGDNSSNRTINTGMQSDLIWIKRRDAANSWLIHDVLRGAGKTLYTDPSPVQAETNSGSYYVQQFNSSNFLIGLADTAINAPSATYSAWVWRAGGTGNTINAGTVGNTIASVVSVNSTAKFSIVTYTGNATAGATIAHGLGVAPAMIIIKSRSLATDWIVYHKDIPGQPGKLIINTAGGADAYTANAPEWNNTVPTSSVFTVGGSGYSVNNSGATYVAYCWAEVPGYSKFGAYTGNASTDGPFVYCGFKPSMVLLKAATTSNYGSWRLHDSTRSPTNTNSLQLYLNLNNLEATNAAVDLVSNGFKIRQDYVGINGSGNPHIFMAFAEQPLQFTRAK